MTGAWMIKTSDRVYGPFSAERMRSFASEGRLAASSMIAPEGSPDWREARDEPLFCDMFPAEAAVASEPAAVARASVSADGSEGKQAHFAIVVDLKSRSSRGLEKAILALGTAYQLLPNVWILSTDQTANTVRNCIVPELGTADTLFVVDASRGKAAWFNFGPEADARIRRVWQKAS